MTLYDMMMNPDVPMEEKARMTPMFYAYVQDQHQSNYEIPWSTWLDEQEALLPAA